MNRIDDSRFLLYIEPEKREKSENPINDKITETMALAFSDAEVGSANYRNINDSEHFENGSGWRGSHTTDCGEYSTN